MNKFEEVKRILGTSHLDTKLQRGKVAKEICQLFEPYSPGIFDERELGKIPNAAKGSPTTSRFPCGKDFCFWIPMLDDPGCTVCYLAKPLVKEAVGKPDARLLTDEERMNVVIPCETKCQCLSPLYTAACFDCMAIQHEKAQLAKADADWRAKVERLLELEHKARQDRVERILNYPREFCTDIETGKYIMKVYFPFEEWQTFEKQEGVE